jgi:membrane-associated phospholipid phosphatase
MREMKKRHGNRALRMAGAAGAVAYVIIFALRPSFPTPDKLFVLLVLVAMAFGQAREAVKRFTPFVVLLLVYEQFRGVAAQLNHKVNYMFMVDADRMLFGRLPTSTLQDWFWHGRVQWYDFTFYMVYALHFVLPFALAVLVWKKRASYYWQVVATYVTVSFAGFLTFWAFPAAPPWLASEKGMIEPITRVSSAVWYSLGVQDFPSVYNKITPNPVAAVPSLHATYATLLVIFTYKLFGKKWAALAAVYPAIIFVGTVYTGEHYAIDEIIGLAYAVGGYYAVRGVFSLFRRKPARQPARKPRAVSAS